MFDITFQYSNVYVCTPEISILMEDEEIQEQCLSYVAKPGQLSTVLRGEGVETRSALYSIEGRWGRNQISSLQY